MVVGFIGAAFAFARLSLLEEHAIDDRQFRNVDRLPIVFWIRTGYAAASVGIFDHAHLVPHKTPTIEFVLQDTGSALKIAINRRSIPL